MWDIINLVPHTGIRTTHNLLYVSLLPQPLDQGNFPTGPFWIE